MPDKFIVLIRSKLKLQMNQSTYEVEFMSYKGAFKEKIDIKIKEPKKYKVLMYNDDFTPMDFVVEVLIEIFGKSQEEAVKLMYAVHQSEYAIVGIYTYDIANTKVETAVRKAREEGYPLRLKAEEA